MQLPRAIAAKDTTYIWHYPKIQPTWKSRTVLGYVLILLIGLTLVGSGWLLRQQNQHTADLLRTEGVVSFAQVTAKELVTSHEAAAYYVSYAFSATTDGQPVRVEHKTAVSMALYYAVEPGASIEIVYARSNPHIARIYAMYTPDKPPYGELSIFSSGLIFLLIGVFLCNDYWKSRRLDRAGVIIPVTLLTRATHTRRGCSSYHIAYAVAGIGPIRHTVDQAIFKSLQIGDTLSVVYLPKNPRIFRPQ